MTTKTYAIGIDLGGTFVKYALVSDAGEILFSDKLPVGSEATRNDILDIIENAIQKVIEGVGW